MSDEIKWRELFDKACDFAFRKLEKPGELTCSFSGEDSHFIRFNNGKVRQITHVEQGSLTMELIVERKRASTTVMMCAEHELNEKRVDDALRELQALVPSLPDDPYCGPIYDFGHSQVEREGWFPDPEQVLSDISQASEGHDLAGIWTSGLCLRGNRNSMGQNHWFKSSSFFLDYSLYTAKERAVKGNYGGTHYQRDELDHHLSRSREALAVMELDKIELKPGQYRCYLAPSAVAEIMGIFSWGALSAGAAKRGESCLKDYWSGEKCLSPLFSLSEDFSLGLREQFNGRGEVAPDHLALIDRGQVKELLVSHHSEKEYGLVSNKASEGEAPRSLVMASGDLAEQDILDQLGTGLYISNLHYLNWSDQVKGRVTGMTRFGCMWVEEGEVKGPIKDMRFDETIEHMFGVGLQAVTAQVHRQVATDTYYQRSVGGMQVPGILIDHFTFTL